jgi:hypothetical protein
MSIYHFAVDDYPVEAWRTDGVVRLCCVCGWQTMPGWHLPSLRRLLAEHIWEASNV